MLPGMRADRITAAVAYHGEGPIWWDRLGALRFVDMLAGDVLTLGAGGDITRTPVGSSVAAVIRPRREAGAVVARERDVVLFADDALTEVERGIPVHTSAALRCNEGGCDPQGRFYVGTMAYSRTEGAAAMVRIDPGAAAGIRVLDRLTISNGIGWSPDGTTAYYIDTPTRLVRAFAYAPESGVSEPRVLVEVAEGDGHPDGLTVDQEGGIWVAHNGAGKIVRYDPQGSVTEVVEVGPRLTTSCTFGGTDLGTLFITTSRENLPPSADPAAGSVYAVVPGVRGLPVLPFGA